MVDSIELLSKKFSVSNDNTAHIVLDTANIDYLGKSYIIFNLNREILETEITMEFDNITFIFNGVSSSLTSEFIIMLLKLYSDETIMVPLTKMLSGSTIYLPVQMFFSHHQTYIKKQCVEIKIANTNSNIINIDYLYEKIVKSEILCDTKIPFPIFTISEHELSNNVCIGIPNHNPTNSLNKIQEILWIYKNSGNKQIHPVKNIEIYIENLNKKITQQYLPYYFTIVNQNKFHTNSNHNPNLYLYSFVLNPEYSSLEEGLITKYFNSIGISQELKENINLQDIKQIVCVKSISWIDVIVPNN